MIDPEHSLEINQPIHIAFPDNFENAADSIGNPYDYRPATRFAKKIILDQEVTPPDPTRNHFKTCVQVIFEGERFATHSAADQLAFILNTQIFGNSIGNTSSFFYGQNIPSDRVAKSYPEIAGLENPAYAKDSILLFKPDTKTNGIPLVAILNSPPSQAGNGLYTVQNVSFAWLGGSRKLDSLSRNNIAAAISTYCKKGFPSLSELTNLDGSTFQNPITSSGSVDPDRNFYASDERAMKLRKLVLELLFSLNESFTSMNKNGALISEIDQKAETLIEHARTLGIDLINFSPSAINQQLFTPLNQVAVFASNLIKSMFDITGIDTNYTEATKGVVSVTPDTNLDQTSLDNLSFPRKKLTQKQIDAIAVEGLLGYCIEKLAVTSAD